MLTQSLWLRNYLLMVRWQALRLKPVLPFMVVAQLFTGVGAIIGLSYLVPNIDSDSARFLTTGGPTLAIITLGLVLVPQMVAQSKTAGTFDYIWSLPVPRMAYLAADLTVWLLATLPGALLAVYLGSLYYDFEIQISPMAIPAMLLVALTATNIGYAMAHLSPKPELTAVATNVIIFCLFLFSPINFPSDRLPQWLESVHQVLPVKHAADLIRGTLTGKPAADMLEALLILGAWCLVSFGMTYVAVTKRK